ncbi:MAG: TlpA family protein disulfide reductase [Acidimicrobiales bacterium]
MAADALPAPPREAGAATPATRPVPARVWLPAGVALALLVGFLGWIVARPSSQVPLSKPAGVSAGAGLPRLAKGRVAPAFRLPNLRGGSAVTLAAASGRPVVVNFFASWCHGCQAETDGFAAEARAVRGRVDFIGVDTNETSNTAARRMLARAGATYPVGIDDQGVATTAYGILALPTTIFIARNGRVVGEAFGELGRPALARWIRRLEASRRGGGRPGVGRVPATAARPGRRVCGEVARHIRALLPNKRAGDGPGRGPPPDPGRDRPLACKAASRCTATPRRSSSWPSRCSTWS